MTTQPTGYLCLVLHCHLPYVRHPEHEHFLEENWLYEAITDTYLPLLRVLNGLVRDGVDFRLTATLSPPLISMLRDPLLISRDERHLNRLIELASKEVHRTASGSRSAGITPASTRCFGTWGCSSSSPSPTACCTPTRGRGTACTPRYIAPPASPPSHATSTPPSRSGAPKRATPAIRPTATTTATLAGTWTTTTSSLTSTWTASGLTPASSTSGSPARPTRSRCMTVPGRWSGPRITPATSCSTVSARWNGSPLSWTARRSWWRHTTPSSSGTGGSRGRSGWTSSSASCTSTSSSSSRSRPRNT